MKVLVSQSCLTLCDPKDISLLCPWNSSGQNTGVRSHYQTHAPCIASFNHWTLGEVPTVTSNIRKHAP